MVLSVVIPAYGKSELLVRCLASLHAPTGTTFEVCVIDDGSGLDEHDIRGRAQVSYPLIWRAFDTPMGRSAARNEGIRSTSGDIIVFLDADMEACTRFLDAHLKGHRTHPGTVVIGKIQWPKAGSFHRYIATRGVSKLSGEGPAPPWYFVTGNSSLARGNLPATAPFDESLSGWGGEDMDLCMKLHAAGVSFRYIPDAVSFHHFDGTLTSHIRRTSAYGNMTLPVLVERYPAIREITRLNHLDSFMWRVLVSGVVFRPACLIAELFDRLPLPLCLFDYLTFAAYARGWLEGRKP